MSAWLVRQEGSDKPLRMSSPAAIAEWLRDGLLMPTDEVRGPQDQHWQRLETHPLFADVATEVEPLVGEGPDEVHLDMNPLIDVCLVLLIFFILTITYSALERTIGIPNDVPPEKGAVTTVPIENIQDRVFLVIVDMPEDSEIPVIRIGVRGAMKQIPPDRIESEMRELIRATGRKEMVLSIDRRVQWGLETAILDAAKANGVHEILNNIRAEK